MADNKDTQIIFMEALESLKEYAKVNGNVVTRQDVESYFKDLSLNESKYQMVVGYLLANSITVKGEDAFDNAFLSMLEENSSQKDEEEPAVMMSEEDYLKDEKYIEMYLKDLEDIEELSDTTRAFLLMNIVEDNDK